MKKMRLVKILVICLVVAASAMSAIALTGCNLGSDRILVVVRDANSGTREAFDAVVGITVENLYEGHSEVDGNGTVRTTVRDNPNAIGYISLASVNTGGITDRPIMVDGVPHTNAAAYPISRPFVLAVNENTTLQARAAQFWAFLNSTNAQARIGNTLADTPNGPTRVAFDYAAINEEFGNTAPEGGVILIRGSTSVVSVMNGLIAEFISLVDWAATAHFDVHAAGTSAGWGAAGIASADNANRTIAMASRGLNPTEAAISSQTTIGLDLIVVVVHPENPITNLSVAQLTGIFRGDIGFRNWSDFE